MKKLSSLLAALFFLAISFSANAQTKAGADYFVGKWNVLVKETPNGDWKSVFVLEKKDGKITGVIQDTTGKEITKIDNAELKENEVTVYFNTNGYDVNVVLTKKDEDHATGKMMSMFDAEADRAKATK
jgi:glucan biosynthesis protein